VDSLLVGLGVAASVAVGAIAGLGWWLRKRTAKRKSGNPEEDIYPMW